MNYTIFNNQTGQIFQSGICSNEDYDVQYVPDGYTKIAIESNINQYLDNGILVDIPPSPGVAYVFNFNTKQWGIDLSIQTQLILSERNRLLKESDWTQLVDVTLVNKPAWASYRQQLRDITSQSGYPLNVVWPTQPE